MDFPVGFMWIFVSLHPNQWNRASLSWTHLSSCSIIAENSFVSTEKRHSLFLIQYYEKIKANVFNTIFWLNFGKTSLAVCLMFFWWTNIWFDLLSAHSKLNWRLYGKVSVRNRSINESYDNLIVAGGDNWAKKHGKWHRTTVCEQLLPEIEKAQSVAPQTTKYRYRTVISDQWIHWKFKKKSFHSNITFVNICENWQK